MNGMASIQEMAELDLNDPLFKTDAFMVYGFKVTLHPEERTNDLHASTSAFLGAAMSQDATSRLARMSVRPPRRSRQASRPTHLHLRRHHLPRRQAGNDALYTSVAPAAMSPRTRHVREESAAPIPTASSNTGCTPLGTQIASQKLKTWRVWV